MHIFCLDYVVPMLRAPTSVKSGGKRGRAWKCIPCGFTGEKLTVPKHVDNEHLTPDDFPFVFTMCGFAHFNWSTYTKHVRWYSLHQTMVVDDKRPIEEVTVKKPAPEHLPTMYVQLSVPESVEHWASRKRDGPVSSAPPTTAATSSSPDETTCIPSSAPTSTVSVCLPSVPTIRTDTPVPHR